MEQMLKKLIKVNGKHKNMGLIPRGSLSICNNVDNAMKDLDMAIADLNDSRYCIEGGCSNERASLKRAYHTVSY